MIQIQNKKSFQYALVFAVLLAHCWMIFLPSVNQEFVFADGARFFLNHKRDLLDQYFAYQANTLGMPWTASVLLRAFPHLDALTAVRVLAVAGIGLLVAGYMRIGRYLRQPVSIELLAFLLLNPLIWTYSARGTADFAPAAIAIFGISLVLGETPSLVMALAAGVLLGFSAILKPHVLCVFLFLVGFQWSCRDFRRLRITGIVVLGVALCIVGAYLYVVHLKFGFWFTPPRFQAIHRLSAANIGSNLLAYMGFLVMSAAPFSLAIPGARQFLARHWKMIVPLAIVVLVAAALGIHDQGEMNLGPLDRFVPKPALSAVFVVLSVFCLSPVLINPQEGGTQDQDRLRRAIGICVLITLLVFSLSRPAQRYLLPVLPLFVLCIPQRIIRIKLLICGALVAFIAIDAFIAYSQWCTGTAAMRMVRALDEAHLLAETDPGVIDGDVGNYFWGNDDHVKRYVVVAGSVAGAKITVESGATFAKKAYSLLPRTATNP